MGCDFCKRNVPLTKHHLIPRTFHSTKWFKQRYTTRQMKDKQAIICRDCHDFIHKQWNIKHLARVLNTTELLLAEPSLQDFIRFISKKI